MLVKGATASVWYVNLIQGTYSVNDWLKIQPSIQWHMDRRPKSPATPLFAQKLVQHTMKKASKFRITGFLWREPTGDVRIPPRWVFNAESVSISRCCHIVSFGVSWPHFVRRLNAEKSETVWMFYRPHNKQPNYCDKLKFLRAELNGWHFGSDISVQMVFFSEWKCLYFDTVHWHLLQNV